MDISQIPFLVMETDAHGKLVSLNERFYPYLSRETAGLHPEELFDDWLVHDGEQLIQANLRGKACIFLSEKFEDGRVLYLGVFSDAFNDLSGEMKEVQRINRHLDAIIENSYDGIYITDAEGKTLKTNSAIERITGIPKEYYLNKNMKDLMERGILQDSVTHKVLEEKRTISVMQLNYHGSETVLTGNPVFNEDGEIESVVTNIRDLSELNQLQTALKKANELNRSYQREIDRLKGLDGDGDRIIIKSEKMKRIYETAARIVNADATVMILGETGVGKDILAKYIYNRSARRNTGQFIKVNCGAIPPDLLESELFGYEGGAFTGANKKGKPGMFEMADKGVLFLDEVGEMPLNLQVKLLRVLQEQVIQRVGGTEPKKVNVRIIAATNRNLVKMMEQGNFREDLYYRLNVIPFSIPSLRERRAEILPIAEMYMNRLNDKYGTIKKLKQDLKTFLYHHAWPGNVRELANLLERLVLLTGEDLLGVEHLPSEYVEADIRRLPDIGNQVALKEALELTEQQLLLKAARTYTTTYEIAEALRTSQPTIVRKLKKYGIKVAAGSDSTVLE